MKLVMQIALLLSLFSFAQAAPYPLKPKVVLVVVVDQLRADQLARHGNSGVFGRLRGEGAYFPQAEYGVMASMTCVGHATILTGSYPRENGIAYNAWVDRATGKDTYCVADPEHGISPKNLRGTTLGNELKAVSPKARVFAFSLKDRSSVLLAGAGADGVYWFDEKNGGFVTSSFYSKELTPSWLAQSNRELMAAGLGKKTFSTPLAVGALGTATLAAIKHHKIGTVPGGTDLVGISFSSHDYLGHATGPMGEDMASHLRAIDVQVGRVLSALPKETLVVVTSDHGIPHSPIKLLELGVDSATYQSAELQKAIDLAMVPGVSRVIGSAVYFNRAGLRSAGMDVLVAEQTVKRLLQSEPWSKHFSGAVTGSEASGGQFPSGLIGEQIKNSWVPDRAPDVFAIVRPYHFEADDELVNHMSGHAYDRVVPILMSGPGVTRGVFTGGRVIDIAPTLAFLLGILPPALSEGRVLSEAIALPQLK